MRCVEDACVTCEHSTVHMARAWIHASVCVCVCVCVCMCVCMRACMCVQPVGGSMCAYHSCGGFGLKSSPTTVTATTDGACIAGVPVNTAAAEGFFA